METLTIGGFIIALLQFFVKNDKKNIIFAILVTFLVALAYDSIVGFTYSTSIQNKVESIDRIEKIMSNPKIDSLTKAELAVTLSETVNRQHYSTLLSRVFLYFSNSLKKSQVNLPHTQNAETNNTYKKKYSINNYADLFSVQFLTSSWFIILLMIFFNTFILTVGTSKIEDTIVCTIVSFFLISVAIAISNLCSSIPILGNNHYYNYLLNMLLGVLFPFGLLYSIASAVFTYETYLETNNIVFPNPNDYESFIPYFKARMDALKRN